MGECIKEVGKHRLLVDRARMPAHCRAQFGVPQRLRLGTTQLGTVAAHGRQIVIHVHPQGTHAIALDRPVCDGKAGPIEVAVVAKDHSAIRQARQHSIDYQVRFAGGADGAPSGDSPIGERLDHSRVLAHEYPRTRNWRERLGTSQIPFGDVQWIADPSSRVQAQREGFTTAGATVPDQARARQQVGDDAESDPEPLELPSPLGQLLPRGCRQPSQHDAVEQAIPVERVGVTQQARGQLHPGLHPRHICGATAISLAQAVAVKLVGGSTRREFDEHHRGVADSPLGERRVRAAGQQARSAHAGDPLARPRRLDQLRRQGHEPEQIAKALNVPLEEVEKALVQMRMPRPETTRGTLNVTLDAHRLTTHRLSILLRGAMERLRWPYRVREFIDLLRSYQIPVGYRFAEPRASMEMSAIDFVAPDFAMPA